MQRVFERNDARVRTESCCHKASGGLSKPHRCFGVHAVVDGSNHAGIKGIAAARGVHHVEFIGWYGETRAVTMGIISPVSAQRETAGRGAVVDLIPGAIVR